MVCQDAAKESFVQSPNGIIPTIDGHTDVMGALLRSHPDPLAAFLMGREGGRVALPRLRRGGIGAAVCACFVTDEEVLARRALAETVRLVDLLRRIVAAGRGQVELVLDAAQLRHCLQRGT